MVTVQIEYSNIGSEKDTYHIFISVSSIFYQKIILFVLFMASLIHELGHYLGIYIKSFMKIGIYIIKKQYSNNEKTIFKLSIYEPKNHILEGFYRNTGHEL